MGWLDRLLGRRASTPEDPTRETAQARVAMTEEPRDDASVADQLEETAHELRDQQYLGEAKQYRPPGTG